MTATEKEKVKPTDKSAKAASAHPISPGELMLRSIPFCLLIALGMVGFKTLANLRQVPDTRQNVTTAPLVETLEIRANTDQITLEADGEAVPFRQVSLAAQVAGRITDKTQICQAGHYVRQGELLMQIDPSDYDLEVRRTQELLKQTAVSVEELDVEVSNTLELVKLAEQERDLQDRELARYEELIQERAISQSALDTVRRGRIQSINALRALQNQTRLLGTRRGRLLSDKDRLVVQLEQAMLNRQRCDIVAPINGVIVSDPVEKDDFVQTGAIVIRIEDTERIEVRFELKMDQLKWIWAGRTPQTNTLDRAQSSYELPQLPVTVGVNIDARRFQWEGTLARYDDAGLNPATRTVPCIAIVQRPREGRWSDNGAPPQNPMALPGLMRGMFVNVQIQVRASEPLLDIPLVAVRPGRRVWLVRDGRLVITEIDIAQSVDDRVLVQSNPSSIAAGDQLITTPLSLAVHGMQVRTDSEPTMTVAEFNSDAATASDKSQARHDSATAELPTASSQAAESEL